MYGARDEEGLVSLSECMRSGLSTENVPTVPSTNALDETGQSSTAAEASPTQSINHVSSGTAIKQHVVSPSHAGTLGRPDM